jgi:hypothetical protein
MISVSRFQFFYYHQVNKGAQQKEKAVRPNIFTRSFEMTQFSGLNYTFHSSCPCPFSSELFVEPVFSEVNIDPMELLEEVHDPTEVEEKRKN